MLNYQIVLNLCSYMLAISFPVALFFMICQKIIASFLGVVFGKNISF